MKTLFCENNIYLFNILVCIFILDNSSSDDNMTFRVQSEANLTAEVGLVILDALSSYCVHFKDTLMMYNGENDIMESVFSTLVAFLCIPQSTLVCGHVFATLRSFINNFSCVLFKGNLNLNFIPI